MDDSAGTAATYVGLPGAAVDSGAETEADGELVRTGTRIGRYVIDTHVGAGAMGRIYAAHDPELDRRVAIKLLRAERDDELGRDRLLREARALARLAHPHVVAVYDAGTVGDRVFVAMEYVSGTTLREVLGRRRHDWREVIDLMSPVAEGLAAVHAAGLVHRDLKPDNIMIGDDGRGRLMDFGLACAPARASREDETTAPGTGPADDTGPALTRTGMRIGTPSYMAPEQWRGDAADARTDQFAFCVTMWEALHGERPFRGATLPELERSITEGRVSPPSPGAEVPRWLQRALVRGLSVSPVDRHPSMGGLMELLVQGRRRRRTRWMAGAVVAVAAIAAVIGIGATRERAGRPDRAGPAASAAVQLPAHRVRCEAPQVCAQGPFSVPLCVTAGGDAVGDSRPCTPGADARCPQGEACVATASPEGEVGRCLPVCEVQDDRVACVPGCYNQQCLGRFDLCARAHGTCRPVPCATDDQCASAITCDFPARGGTGFRCNVEAGFCERNSAGAVAGDAPEPRL